MGMAPDARTEELVEEALELAQVAWWEYDPAARAFACNRGLYERILRTDSGRMGGYSLPLDRLLDGFVAPIDRAPLTQALGKVMASPDPKAGASLIVRLRFPGGGEGSVLCVMRRREGKIWGVTQEVTDKMMLMDDVQEQRERRHEAMEVARLGYWELDPDSGMFLLDDDCFNNILGQAPGEGGVRTVPVDRFIERYLVPERVEPFRAMLREVREHPEGVQQRRLESGVRRADGAVIDVLVTARLRRRGDGAARFYGTAQDITDRKDIERALARREAFLRAMLDTLPFSAWLKDTEGRFLAVNRLFAQQAGRDDPEALVGSTDLDVFPQPLAEAQRADDRVVMTSGRRKMAEERGQDRGVDVWVETYKTPVNGPDGRLLGTAGFSRDITDRKLGEEHQRGMQRELERRVEERTREIASLLRQKEDLIVHLGHDLKTPLTPLLALLPLLRQGEQSPEKNKMLDMMESSIRGIQRVVVNTLDLARLASPDTPVMTERLALREFFDKARRDLRPDEAARVAWDNQVAAEVAVKADRRFLHKLLMNLLSNACQYSPEGGTVRLEARVRGPWIEASVSDQGQGIDAEMLEAVFEEYNKADKSRHTLSATGLGLSICRKVVERHGGRIWAASPGIGQGATFTFTMPAA